MLNAKAYKKVKPLVVEKICSCLASKTCSMPTKGILYEIV